MKKNRYFWPLILFLLSCIAFSSLVSPAAFAQEAVSANNLGRMDRDGRISAYPRPDSLNNPRRWRYFPPERIVKGNFFDRLLVSSFIAPIFFRDSDVGTGGGVALTDIDFREQRRQEFAGIFLSYTTEGQQNYSFTWRRWQNHIDLPNGGVLQDERSHLTLRGGYKRSLTKRFFGFGDKTKEEDESSYTDEIYFLGINYQLSLPDAADNLILNLGASAASHYLSDGEVSGAPSTADAFPVTFADAKSHQLLWLNAGIAYDTRDSQVNPYDGFAVGAQARNAVLQSGGDFGGRYKTFATIVFPVPPIFYSPPPVEEENPPTDTVGLYAELETSAGDLPFFARPTLGGSYRQRGYIENRFTGDALWFAGIEHRFWFLPRGFRIDEQMRVERVGLATFYEAGSVSDEISNLGDAEVKHSYGVGLRFTLERSAPFRVDIGFSEEDVEVSARFGLSF